MCSMRFTTSIECFESSETQCAQRRKSLSMLLTIICLHARLNAHSTNNTLDICCHHGAIENTHSKKKTLTQIHGGHFLGHILIDVSDAQREQRRCASTVQQLRHKEQPHGPGQIVRGWDHSIASAFLWCYNDGYNSVMLFGLSLLWRMHFRLIKGKCQCKSFCRTAVYRLIIRMVSFRRLRALPISLQKYAHASGVFTFSIPATVPVAFPPSKAAAVAAWMLLLLLLQTLLCAPDARYEPTRKCGNANVNDPRPMTTTPQPSQRGFEAPMRPPKYVTGTRQRNDAMS